MFKYFSILILLLSCHATASLVTLQSLSIDKSFKYPNGFKTYWDTNTLGLNAPDVIEVDTFKNIRTGGYKLNLLSIEFDLPSHALFSVFGGLDAHYGADIYVDNELVFSKYVDLWWGENWNHRSVVELENTLLSAGQNVIDIFWAESCCNGPNSVRFSIDKMEPIYLNVNSLNFATTEISGPNNIALMALGLFGLIGLSSKK